MLSLATIIFNYNVFIITTIVALIITKISQGFLEIIGATSAIIAAGTEPKATWSFSVDLSARGFFVSPDVRDINRRLKKPTNLFALITLITVLIGPHVITSIYTGTILREVLPKTIGDKSSGDGFTTLFYNGKIDWGNTQNGFYLVDSPNAYVTQDTGGEVYLATLANGVSLSATFTIASGALTGNSKQRGQIIYETNMKVTVTAIAVLDYSPEVSFTSMSQKAQDGCNWIISSMEAMPVYSLTQNGTTSNMVTSWGSDDQPGSMTQQAGSYLQKIGDCAAGFVNFDYNYSNMGLWLPLVITLAPIIIGLPLYMMLLSRYGETVWMFDSMRSISDKYSLLLWQQSTFENGRCGQIPDLKTESWQIVAVDQRDGTYHYSPCRGRNNREVKYREVASTTFGKNGLEHYTRSTVISECTSHDKEHTAVVEEPIHCNCNTYATYQCLDCWRLSAQLVCRFCGGDALEEHGQDDCHLLNVNTQSPVTTRRHDCAYGVSIESSVSTLALSSGLQDDVLAEQECDPQLSIFSRQCLKCTVHLVANYISAEDLHIFQEEYMMDAADGDSYYCAAHLPGTLDEWEPNLEEENCCTELHNHTSADTPCPDDFNGPGHYESEDEITESIANRAHQKVDCCAQSSHTKSTWTVWILGIHRKLPL